MNQVIFQIEVNEITWVFFFLKSRRQTTADSPALELAFNTETGVEIDTDHMSDSEIPWRLAAHHARLIASL